MEIKPTVAAHNYPLIFCLRSFFKGRLYYLAAAFFATCLISTVVLWSAERGELAGPLITDLLGLMLAALVVTIFGLWLFGLPASLIPSAVTILILTVWLYQQSKAAPLSIRRAQVQGTMAGALAALLEVVLFVHFYPAKAALGDASFWALWIVIPLAGAVASALFSKNLAAQLQPAGDYFSIDSEALQRERDNSQ